MTRKDYEKFASMLRVQRARAKANYTGTEHMLIDSTIMEVAQDMCTVFKTDNPNFSIDRFMDAIIV
jgi:hypothetical protein